MTFQGPAQWKGHTSCVTEAEKYQKSLYAGPKKVRRDSSFSSHCANERIPTGFPACQWTPEEFCVKNNERSW